MIWLIAIVGAAGMAIDAYFEIAPVLQEARETRQELASSKLNTFSANTTYCTDDTRLRVYLANGDVEDLDATNLTFLVDGAITTGFDTDVGGHTSSGFVAPGSNATFNKTWSGGIPDHLSLVTGEGAVLHAMYAPCPALATIVLSPASATMEIGDEQVFTATGYDQYGVLYDGSPYSWVSDCGAITQLTPTTARLTAGTVAGACTVSAASDTVNGEAAITITPDAPATITVAPDPAGLAAGSTQAFSSTARDQYGNVNTTAPITWSTNAGSIDGAGVLTVQTTAQLGRSVTATWTTVSGSATVDVYAAAPVTAVVTPDGAGVTVGTTQAYAAVLTDVYGNVNSTATITWTTNAGTISGAGVLTAQTTAATGRTVTATSGAASDVVTVDVIADAPSTIALTPAGAGVTVGTTQQYAAVLYDAYGNVNGTATTSWSTNAGSISASGLLTAQTTAASGRTVTATSGAASSQVTVDVIAAAPATALVLPDGAGVTAGGTRAYSATLYDAYGNINGTAPVSWSTNGGSISGAGVLTAQTTVASGKTVTATSGAASDSATFDVIAAAPSTIALTPAGAGVTVGTTQQYAAVLYDAYGNVNGTATTSWSTNAGSISASGLLTAQTTAASGRTVTATSGAASSQVTVDVIAAAPSSLVIASDPVGVAAGGTFGFAPYTTVYDQYGNVNATATISWSTNAGSISAAGVLTAQTTAQLGRSVTATSGSASDTATVDVYAAAPSTITLSPTSAIVNTTLTQQFTATVRDQYSNVNSTATVTWSATRGTVSASGLYTAPSTTGADTVTATSGAASQQAAITVQRAIHIDSVTMYKANVTSSTFSKGPPDVAEARVIVRDHLGDLVQSVSVTLQWVRPNTNVDHTDVVTTSAAGAGRAYWAVAAPTGTWTARVSAMSGTDMWYDTAANVATQATFSVTN